MLLDTIYVHEHCGPICIDADSGAELCALAFEALSVGDSIVCLDFTGVSTLASAFLNASVGCLYASFSPEDLEQRLRWAGLDTTDEAVLKFVQENAMEFYAEDAVDQQSLIDAEESSR